MTDDGIKMTYSAILTGKDKKKMVSVSFERINGEELEVAEGILPDCKIVRQNGYSQTEINSLEDYLVAHADDIMAKAKVISNPLKWL